jgi:D-3-phosphoglycerate dehydrogenase / 2-oxoglutarate reductase
LDRKRILIVDKMHPSIVPFLEEQGFIVDHESNITRKEIINRIGDYYGLIVRSKTLIDAEVLKNATNLRFVARAGAGIDQLDLKGLQSKAIKVINAPEGNRDALGEHALGMLLSVANKINHADAMIRQKIWDREGHRGFEIKNKTVALIGYGQMGSAFSEKLSGLGCRVIAYDKYKNDFSSNLVKAVSMNQIFENADILSFHVPLTEETKNLANESFFSKFRKNIVVINTSRGEVLNLRDLLKMIKIGKVTGAALDVLENEKLGQLTDRQEEDFENLIKSEKVLLTPHVGGWTFESYERINQVLADKISRLLD